MRDVWPAFVAALLVACIFVGIYSVLVMVTPPPCRCHNVAKQP